MNNPGQYVLFVVEGRKYALSLAVVSTVVRAVEITPLPKAPSIVLGIINMRGRVIPVCDIRKRFGLPPRELRLSDQLIIAHTPRRPVALVVDRADGVVDLDGQEIVKPGEVVPQTDYVAGVAKLKDGLILIHDLAGFLSLDEEDALNEALKESGQPR